MKLIAALAIVMLFTASCHHRGNRIVISDGTNKLDINYSGEIKFTEDETTIKSISPRGYLRYRKNDKRLEAHSIPGGDFKLELYDNGRKLSATDNDGKVFLADAIKEMVSVGFGAKERMQRIFKKGGSRAILNEVAQVKGDFIKSMYLEFLLTVDTIQPKENIEIATIISTQIGSDFEKGKLLSKYSAKQLKDSLIVKAYLIAAKTINSDFEKSNALKHLLNEPLTGQEIDETLIVTTSIGSDFEKANVLKIALTQPLISNQSGEAITVTNTIGSDFEKANVLKIMIDKGLYEKESFNILLDAVSRIGSDFEKGNLLKQLIEKGFKDDAQWKAVIGETAKVSSEFDRSNLLVLIAKQMPKNESLKSAYMEVAKSIHSEMDYGRVVKAVQ